MKLRPLTSDEESVIKHLWEKGRITGIFDSWRGGQVRYTTQKGGFTVCELRMPIGSDLTVGVGASRRSYKDKPNSIRGRMLALVRAIEDIDRQLRDLISEHSEHPEHPTRLGSDASIPDAPASDTPTTDTRDSPVAAPPF